MPQTSQKELSDNITNASQSVKRTFSSPTPTLSQMPMFYEIPMQSHVFQSFNNCGPATLVMALSYMGIQKDQEELGRILRPYQIPGGDNDDKSVTLKEVADQAEIYGLHSYLRPNGNIEKLKQFISNDIPVVARTWLKNDEDIGHYRVVRGYDDTTQEIIQDDSLQGKNLTYTYDEFNNLWKTFNYEYLVIVNEDKKEIVEQILDEELDEMVAWENARARTEQELFTDPNNIHLRFALSRIYYFLGNFEKSVAEFNKVENSLSFRTLWYQIEPILSIYETGDYGRVFQITEKILNNQNRAFSELYILRGKMYQNQGNIEKARYEFQNALRYNANNKEAQQLLAI